MRFVLDASIAMCWLYRDEQDNRADVALDHLRSRSDAVVPALWWYEIRNAALVGTRRSRISSEEIRDFLADIDDLPIVASHVSNDEAIFALAHRHRLTFYDAAYLELAHREGVALATLDQALVKAAVAENVALIGR